MEAVGLVAQAAGVEHQEQAGRAGGVSVVAEVLAEAQRLLEVVHIALAERLGDGLVGELQQSGVVDHGAVALGVLHVELAAAELLGAAGETHDLVVDHLAVGLAVGAADHLHAGAAGDDVHGLAALDDADGDYRGVQRADAARDYLLRVHDKLSRREDRVVAVVRLGAVRGLAGDVDVVEVEGRGDDAVVHAHGADLHALAGGGDVRGEDGVHVRVLKRARLDHRPGAAHRSLLLGGLENELHAAAKLVAHTAEHLRHAEQHGRVRVVAAGVHHAVVLAGEVQAGLLLDGQGVYVRADGHALAGLGALYQRHRAGGQGTLHAVHAEALEELDYLLGGTEFVVAQLRVAVEVAPPGDHLVVHLVYTAAYVHDVLSFLIYK